ncbi:MAG: RHS repeat protein [Lachnospiraceae bacterium]|nr:RHS repeat protein [Lachnospiraceae bacterium]
MVEQMTNETVQNEGEKKWKKYLKYLPIFLVLAAIMVYCIVIFVSDKPDNKKPATNTSGNKTNEAGPTEKPSEAPEKDPDMWNYTAREYEVVNGERLLVGSRTVKFDELGRLVSETDEDDLKVTEQTFSYDELGRIVCVTIVVTQLDNTKTKDTKVLFTYHGDTDVILEETRYDFGELTGSMENEVAFDDVVTSSKLWMKGEKPRVLIEYDPVERVVKSNQYVDYQDGTGPYVEFEIDEYYDAEGRVTRQIDYWRGGSNDEFIKISWDDYQYYPDTYVRSGFQSYTDYGIFCNVVCDDEGRMIRQENNSSDWSVLEWESNPLFVDGMQYTEYHYSSPTEGAQADWERAYRKVHLVDADHLIRYLAYRTFDSSVLLEGREKARALEPGENFINVISAVQIPEHSGKYYGEECFQSVERDGGKVSEKTETEFDEQGRRLRRHWTGAGEILEEYDEHGNMKRRTTTFNGDSEVTEWDYEYFR